MVSSASRAIEAAQCVVELHRAGHTEAARLVLKSYLAARAAELAEVARIVGDAMTESDRVMGRMEKHRWATIFNVAAQDLDHHGDKL